MKRSISIILAILFFPAFAVAEDQEAKSKIDFDLSGYMELDFSAHDYAPNRNRTGGSKKDFRLIFDQTRLALDLEVKTNFGMKVVAEVEFEHGGTGSALELEYEEFGEFEQEVEAGGEVIVEELFIQQDIGDLRLRVGKFNIGVGHLASRHKPGQLLGGVRPESEQLAIPAVWNEMGIQARYKVSGFTFRGELVNGLDSTGFSSQRWVASGHQTRFENIVGTSLAGVLRSDYKVPVDSGSFEVGVSGYYGGTTLNRPKVDLVPNCSESNETSTAPCGTISAPVMIAELHWEFFFKGLQTRGLVLFGHLEKAEQISTANSRLSNNLGVLRSPVADNAFLGWVELGYDLGSIWLEEWKISPFVRGEYVDTFFQPRENTYDNPRFERWLFTAGVQSIYNDFLVSNLEFEQRRFGNTKLNIENSLRISLGALF